MNESIFTRTIKNAFNVPIKMPSVSATKIAGTTAHLWSTKSHETVTAEAETVAAIERSKTPAESGTSSPSATTIRIDC